MVTFVLSSEEERGYTVERSDTWATVEPSAVDRDRRRHTAMNTLCASMARGIAESTILIALCDCGDWLRGTVCWYSCDLRCTLADSSHRCLVSSLKKPKQ